MGESAEEAVHAKIDAGRRSGYLHLSFALLPTMPSAVFSLSNLARLDFGHNMLQHLPAEVGQLGALEQLWLNDNPLESLPAEIEGCRKLKAIDLSNTLVRLLPRQIARLPALHAVELQGAPLKDTVASANSEGFEALVKFLKHKDMKKELKLKLEAKLLQEKYREQAESEEGQALVKVIVKAITQEFKDLEEYRNVIRNVDRLFPEDMRLALATVGGDGEDAESLQIRAVFVKLRRENEMKKLSAELELKIRAIYYDRINPTKVEGIVHSIYEVISELDEVRFLLKHAKELFPEHAAEIDGKVLYDRLIALRDKLAAERQAAVDGLETALRAEFPDVEPPDVKKLTYAVSDLFQKVEYIKKLTADAADHFPKLFEDAIADPKAVKRSFMVALKEELGE